MNITEIPCEGYEKVVRCDDSESGLKALISVHDTTLGPALGGMRMWPYLSDHEALTDVNRLSAGMTYKSAVAETGLGGGKCVIIGNPKTDKEQFRETSPVEQAARIQAPVLVVQGKRDYRLGNRHFKALVKALDRHGKHYEVMVEEFEGHGYRGEANRIALYTKIEAFLARYLSAR